MNVFAVYTQHVHDCLRQLADEGAFALPASLDKVVVEAPREASHGDLATNAAMVLTKETGLKPRDLAEKLIGKLKGVSGVNRAEIAGPGFINIVLEDWVWPEVLISALKEGATYGKNMMGQGEKVNVEYVSANPTGPMHVGHCRGAVFGDALANLLAFSGYQVTREYYINDAGAQVQVLGRSAYLRYKEALGETIEIPEGIYPGDYLKPVGEALKATYGDSLLTKSEAEWLPICRDKAIDMMMGEIRSDLAALNVKHDVFFSERSLHAPKDQVKALIESLRAEGHVYEGVLPRPKGGGDDDWEEREQTLFRATDFGDDVDRPLMKSDGSYTYFASDIAYHRNKFDRGFLNQIDVWGADHGGYVKRMAAAVKATTGGKAHLDVKLCQLVKLFRNGEPVRMSKRSGDFVTLAEVVDEVGVDSVRFMMLMRKNDAALDFDLAKVIEQSKDNPVFYVQYAHARCCSILRNAKEQVPDLMKNVLEELDKRGKSRLNPITAGLSLGLLSDEGELGLIKLIGQFPRQVEAATQAHEPHRIAFALHDLASSLHSHWNKGRDLPHLRFIMENDSLLTSARLCLVQAVAHVLASGLSILGVGAPEEMR